MLKQSNEDFNPNLTHDTGGSVIWSHQRSLIWNPGKSGKIIRPFFCAEFAMPAGFPSVTEALNGDNNEENIGLV